MKIFTRLMGCALLVPLFAATLLAQAAAIRGQLLEENNEGIDGIEITLEATDGANSYTFETDDDGNFLQEGVAPGLYQISFIVDDTAYVTAARVGTGSLEFVLNIGTLRFEGDEETGNTGRTQRVTRELNQVPAAQFRAAAEADEAAADAATVRAAFEAGRAAMDAGNFPEAVMQFSLAARGSSEQVVHANLGLAYERSEMWNEAAESYERAQTLLEGMEEPPAGVNYFPNLTLAYAMSGDVDRAIEFAERGAEVDPAGAGQAFYNVGAILTNQGDTAGATQAFERAVEVSPDMANAYFQLALGKLNSEATIPEAVPLLERYLELAPDGENAPAAQGLLEFARSGQ